MSKQPTQSAEITSPRGRPRGSKNFGGGNKQGDRAVTVAVALKPQLRELLLAASADQFRSHSQQAAKYIVDGLIRDGYIRPSKIEEAA